MAKRVIAAAFLLAAIAFAAPVAAQTFPERGRAAVVDGANEIPDTQEQALAELLTRWERETGHQLVVATVADLQGYPISDYANRLFRHWRLGRARINDGILILHAPRERRIRIEVGYGLEGTVTDALSSRIIREAIIPDLERDPGEALTLGAMRIMAAASGPAQGEPAPRTGNGTAPARFVDRPHPDDEGPSGLSVLLWSLVILFLIGAFIVWLVRRGRKPLPSGPVRPLSKRAQRRREHQARRRAGDTTGITFDHQQSGPGAGTASVSWSSSDSSSSWSSSDSGSSWSSSDSGGGFDSGGGDSGGGGSDSSY